MSKKILVTFKEWDCVLQVGHYPNGRIAMWLIEEGTAENIATCTVNLPDDPLGTSMVHIKEWSENEGMTNALMSAGVIKHNYSTVPVGPYGSKASLCELKMKFIINIKPKRKL